MVQSPAQFQRKILVRLACNTRKLCVWARHGQARVREMRKGVYPIGGGWGYPGGGRWLVLVWDAPEKIMRQNGVRG